MGVQIAVVNLNGKETWLTLWSAPIRLDSIKLFTHHEMMSQRFVLFEPFLNDGMYSIAAIFDLTFTFGYRPG